MNDHITDDLTTDMAIAAALRTFLTSPAIISMIQACVTEAANVDLVQRLISDDRIRNVIKDELEDCPRYFTRAVEDIVQGSIDIDDIADTVKDRVIDDLDLDTVVSDKLIEHFDDDDNLRFMTKRVVESISSSITPSR